MARVDIMTDIETLGTKSDSTIFQVSAIAFDIKTGNHISSFNSKADISENENLVVDGDTLKWWLNTDKELLTRLLNEGKYSSEILLGDFHGWLCEFEEQGDDLYLWGNGILFDNKMIQHQFEKMHLEYPIFYKNDRDVRTLVDLTCAKLRITETKLKKSFNDDSLVSHDAFDDVKYQINLVTHCYILLTRGGNVDG